MLRFYPRFQFFLSLHILLLFYFIFSLHPKSLAFLVFFILFYGYFSDEKRILVEKCEEKQFKQDMTHEKLFHSWMSSVMLCLKSYVQSVRNFLRLDWNLRLKIQDVLGEPVQLDRTASLQKRGFQIPIFKF